MISGFVKFGLQVAQMPDKTINDLDQSLPGFSRIAAAFKELEPILIKADPHAEALQPLINQAIPIIKKVWPDIVTSVPTVQELLAFVNSKA